MTPYPKIESLYVRDPVTFGFTEELRLVEFDYLKHNLWLWTEKVDGTNIRVMWDGEKVRIGGRTDDAQIPTFLYDRLIELFPPEKFADPMCLYGEGYGAKIQKGGGNYKVDGVDFVLFDIKVGPWWLRWDDVNDIASKMNVPVVPLHGCGGIDTATQLVREGFESAWGDFRAEGLVLRPAVDLVQRNGKRIIAKIKTKDFKETK
jgi:hypothetical protein